MGRRDSHTMHVGNDNDRYKVIKGSKCARVELHLRRILQFIRFSAAVVVQSLT